MTKEEFINLCKKQATKKEILSLYVLTYDQMNKFCLDNFNLNFDNAYLKFIAEGKIELRERLFNVMENNDTHITKNQLLMTIYLSKTILGMNEFFKLKDTNISSPENNANDNDPRSHLFDFENV